METLTNISYWEQQFGIYPILMNPKNNDCKFLMLNGGHKDFCLQTGFFEDRRDRFFSESWSTNTKNFVAINKDYIHVYNWLNNKTTKIPQKQVEDNPQNFYSQISSQSYKTPSDAVPHLISIFRELRNLTKEKDPEKALNLLFRLLISIEEDYKNINLAQWEIADIVVPSNFDYYVKRIREGVNAIAPNRDLLLRHVSGALFQEAHKEVIYFDPQMDLFGGFSNKLATKIDAYSSVHYTPQYLARAIVENCLKQLNLQKESLKIFDPSCGSSEFLIEVLKQLENLKYKGKIKIIGWDSSRSAICTSKFLLRYEKVSQWNDDSLEFEIKHVTDSLTEQWDNDYDLIVMNPPFVSWELLKNTESRNAVLDTLNPAIKGKPNQAAAFFYKAAKSLQKNGVLGCVLPSSIFTSDSYSKLRNEIQEEFSLNILAKLGNYVFESALTDVSFFIGQKTQTDILPKLIWSKNEKGTDQDILVDLRKMAVDNQIAVDRKNYSIYTPTCFPIVAESWKIISSKEDKFLKDLKRFVVDEKLTSISHIFTVQQGIRQGKKDIFKITKEEYDVIAGSEKKYFRPVVDNEAIKNGQLFDNKYIWYPYTKSGLIFKNEGEMKEIAFFNKNIKPFEADLKKRAGIQEWWGLTRPRNWQFEKHIKLLSTEFGKSDSFAIDKTGQFVAERGCAWVPKKTFTHIDDYYFYLSIFSSDIFDFLLSIYSKQLAGGNWYDLGAKYTNNIPIPDVHLQNVRESESYDRLVELGKELENGNQYVKYVIGDVVKIYYPNID